MSNESIKFSFNKNKKVYVEVKSDGTIVHGKKDKSKQLATIFEQIAALSDNTTMIDSAEERKLVKMLRAICSLGDNENIDKGELKWINELGTNDVKNYIEAKYNALKGNIKKEYLVADEELAEPKVDTKKQQARDNIIKGLADRVQAVEGAIADGQQVYKETHGTRFFIFNENNEFCEVVEQGGNYVIKDAAAAIKPDDIAEDPRVVAEREAAAQIQAQKAADQQRRNQIKTRNEQLSSKVDNLVKDLGDVTAQKVEHEVKKGDILWNIAIEQLNKQDVTNPSTQQIINMIAQIKKLNPEMDINNLKIGQKIKLPAAKTEPPKGDDQNFVKKDETEQIKLIKEMNLEELDKLAGRVVNTGEGDGDLKDLGNDVKKAIVDRAVELYKKDAGNPANLMNLLKIRTLIKWVNFGEEELPASDKLVQVPDGTKDKGAAQEVFNAANALLAEVANCKPGNKKIRSGSKQGYKWKAADYGNKHIEFREYDSGEIAVLISYANNVLYDVKYVFDENSMTGYVDTDLSNGYDCTITEGIDKEAILALVNKVFNNDPTKEQLRDDILETFFEVTGESEDKTYKFNPKSPMNQKEQANFEEVLNESINEKMKAAYKAYLDNQKAAGLVTVPEGTPEGVQEVFDEANEFLTELANMENKPGVVSERFSDHYEFKTAVGGKKVTICKYDDGTIKIYINSNTDKRYTRASGVKYDANEVMYEIGKNGKIIGWYNNIDYSNEAMDGKITEGIDQAAIEELARKILNRGKYQTDFNNIVDYYVDAYVGEKLYGEVKGAGSGDGADILNGGEITKDNIIGVIEGFNAKGSLYDDQCITEFLRNELFLTKDTVLKPANYLLKKAESVNLTNSPEYTNLKKAMEDYRSYPFDHYAQEVDKCIDALINKIKEIEAKK